MLLVPPFPARAGRPAVNRGPALAGVVLLAGFAGFFAAMFWSHDQFSRDIQLTDGQVSRTVMDAGND